MEPGSTIRVVFYVNSAPEVVQLQWPFLEFPPKKLSPPRAVAMIS